MKTLFSLMFVAAVCAAPCLSADTPAIAGTWQMTVQSPHGPIQGPMQLKQDGATFSGTYDAQMFGSMQVAGKVEGKTVSFTLEMKEQQVTLTFSGTIDGNKMSGTFEPHSGSWTATRERTDTI